MLQPGQSLTLHAIWNGVPNQAGSSPILAGGTFSVTNELDPGGASASFQIASPLSYALSVDRSDYQVGQPIQISDTETNMGSQPLSVNVRPASFTIADDLNNVVWQSAIGSGSSTTQTLEPGQSITQTSTWNGISNTGRSPNTNPWGSFVVSSPSAPSGLTATFSIDDPYSTSLTTGSTSASPATAGPLDNACWGTSPRSRSTPAPRRLHAACPSAPVDSHTLDTRATSSYVIGAPRRAHAHPDECRHATCRTLPALENGHVPTFARINRPLALGQDEARYPGRPSNRAGPKHRASRHLDGQAAFHGGSQSRSPGRL